MPNSSVEFVMRGEFAAVFFYKGFAKFDCIAFEDDVKVVDGLSEEKVTHEATDHVTRHPQGLGLGGNLRE